MVSLKIMERARKHQIRRKGRRVTCQRCGWTWIPFSGRTPTRCANPECRSPYWHLPRQKDRGHE
jgi:predicted Zn-ribbon and HTH transcriptional regulator